MIMMMKMIVIIIIIITMPLTCWAMQQQAMPTGERLANPVEPELSKWKRA